jgi:hypothetical protein
MPSHAAGPGKPTILFLRPCHEEFLEGRSAMDKNDTPDQKAAGNARFGSGLAMGIAIGIALGVAMENIGAGIAIGVALGAGIGTTLKNKAGKK